MNPTVAGIEPTQSSPPVLAASFVFTAAMVATRLHLPAPGWQMHGAPG
jgi:hypothetical protein